MSYCEHVKHENYSYTNNTESAPGSERNLQNIVIPLGVVHTYIPGKALLPVL